MKRFAFLSGLPRTGSTVLGTLLSQHPDLHPTATSVVRDQLLCVKKYNLGESPYYNIKDEHSPCWAMMRGMLYGAYEHVTEEVVVEKDRGWAANVDLIRHLTNEEPRIISPVRPIPEIIASLPFIYDLPRVNNAAISSPLAASAFNCILLNLPDAIASR